jgi:F-type H+-transporting ATPase subunit a
MCLLTSLAIERISTPLEQFTVICLVPIRHGNFDFSFTNASAFMALPTLSTLLLFTLVCAKGGTLVPNAWQSFVEMNYEFVVSLVHEQIGEKGKKYFPMIFVLFTFLLTSNLVGMVPYGFTTTSHFVVTFGLSVSLFIGVTLIGFSTHGIHFFSLFLPPGAPLPLAPFLVIIEVVSYGFRAISLGVRLFANMLAGHTLVKILSGFAWTMIGCGGALQIAAIIPFLIVYALMFLEVGVACLQAYVFAILTCIYLNDAIHLH